MVILTLKITLSDICCRVTWLTGYLLMIFSIVICSLAVKDIPPGDAVRGQSGSRYHIYIQQCRV